jgi:ferrochelatase
MASVAERRGGMAAPSGDSTPSERLGVLLANVGTPDAPTYWAVRRFLRQFLSDPQVIKLSRWLWLPILYLFILTFRPFRSARAYRRIWTEDGSPLLVHGRAQVVGVQERLRARFGEDLQVVLGMSYGTPSVASALSQLDAAGCGRVLCLPLYPQGSGTTTVSVRQQVVKEARGSLTEGPGAVEFLPSYPTEASYITALAFSVRAAWAGGEPEVLLLSFHGIPSSYVSEGDDYPSECQATASALRVELGLAADRVQVAYQSSFGPAEWIGPSFLERLDALAAQGIKRVDVLCPGFASDCLETLEEIGIEGKEHFAGLGGALRLIPCLNDSREHLDALSSMLGRAIEGL